VVSKCFKFNLLMHLCLICCGFALFLSGCRDNPQDRAAKNVHREIQKAIAQDDPVLAQQQVQSAIATHRPSGLAQDSANWVNGSLMLQQGLSLKSDLFSKSMPIRQSISAISSLLVQSEQWLFEKERIASMLALGEREISELSALLSGTPENPGFQKQLAIAQAELAKLQTQQKKLQAEHDAVLTLLANRQSQADGLLRQAEMAQGDTRLALHQQAYEILLGGKDDYVNAQTLENKLGIVSEQIALAQNQVDLLQDSVRQTQAKIEALESAPSRPQLKSQLAEIDQLLAERRLRIYAHADTIKTAMTDYLQTADQIVQLFEDAADQFGRVNSMDAGFAAAFRQADSLAYAGITLGEKMNFIRQVALRLSGIVAASDETLARGLAERLPMNAELNAQEIEKFNALFAAAEEAYQDAAARARRIPKTGQQAACTVLKSHLLSVYLKMSLADAMKLFDLANQTQTRLEELKKEAQEYGDMFTFSTTAQLLEKGLDFTPSLPVNVELYFEGIRQRFGEWKNLRTPQEQAAMVERNLAEMTELIKTYGEEMAKLLEPIKQEMLTAKEQGFAAPEAEQTETPVQEQPEAAPEQMNMMMPPMMPGMPVPQQ